MVTMKKTLLFLLACSLTLHAQDLGPTPKIPKAPRRFPKAAHSGQQAGITSAIIAANIGVLAVLAVLALSNAHDHAHSHFHAH